MEIKIEKDIPIPVTEIKYPFDKMDIGDSFFIPENDKKVRFKIQCAVRSYFNIYRKKTNFIVESTMKITSKSLEDGVRVWRIE